MAAANPSPRSRAEQVRELLARREPIVMGGFYDGVSARLVDKAGFPLAFMGGYAVAASLLGEPDIGLLTQAEMAEALRPHDRQGGRRSQGLAGEAPRRAAASSRARPLRRRAHRRARPARPRGGHRARAGGARPGRRCGLRRGAAVGRRARRDRARDPRAEGGEHGRARPHAAPRTARAPRARVRPDRVPGRGDPGAGARGRRRVPRPPPRRHDGRHAGAHLPLRGLQRAARPRRPPRARAPRDGRDRPAEDAGGPALTERLAAVSALGPWRAILLPVPASLTVLMPALNEAANIEAAARGILDVADEEQADVELIALTCLDRDGGSDGTPDVVRALAAADPRVRCVHSDAYQLLGEKLRAGIALATKAHVVMIPGDNEIEPRSLRAVLRRIG